MMNKIVRKSLFESNNNLLDDIDFVFQLNPILATVGSKEQYSFYLDSIFPYSKIKNIVYHTTDNLNLQFKPGQIHFYMDKKSLDTVNSKFHSIKRAISSSSISKYSREIIEYLKSNKELMDGTWKRNIEKTYNELLQSKNINKFNKKNKTNISFKDIEAFLNPEIICAILDVRNSYNAVEPINTQRVNEIKSRNNNIDAIIGGESWTINSTAKDDSWGDIEVATEKEIVVFNNSQVYMLGFTEDANEFKKFIKNKVI